VLAISCGVALHHAVTALTPAAVEVQLASDPADPDVLACMRLRPDRPPDDSQLTLRAAIKRRRTDRRTFARVPIGDDTIAALMTASERQGAHLYVVPWHQMSTLALAAVRAGAGLGSAPISDVTETGPTRDMLDAMLPGGHAQVALRVGHPSPGQPTPTPRRLPDEVIHAATSPR
jgi:hypothetical protein